MMHPTDAAPAVFAWWDEIRPDPANRRPGDRVAFARLRRCATVAEAMQETATILLFRRLRGTGPGDLPKAALTAAVLAHVRADVSGVSVARHVGPSSLETPETALLKPLRFRRLMETVGWDERLTAFRRLAALAGASLPVQDLARALLFWNDESRRRWVLDYWNAVPPPSPAEPAKDATP